LLGGLLYVPYLQVRQETGFARSLAEARVFSADWRAYLASNAWAHRWMLRYLQHWNEVLFPGFLATGLGVIGAGIALKRLQNVPRDTIVFYAVVGGVALWASFGPSAGLYTLLYKLVPMFSFMHAPARLGVVVMFCLTVLAAFGVASIVRDRRRGAWIAAALTAAAAAELAVIPIRWPEARSLPSPYRILAGLPRGPVVEMPFFYRRQDFPRHTLYMLSSTYHWQPLINGYSDVIPPDFREMVNSVSRFPSRESFAILRRLGARYAVFHVNLYEPLNRRWALEGLEEFAPYLRLIARDGDVWLYEIIDWPP
jgi:hypothetical protein